MESPTTEASFIGIIAKPISIKSLQTVGITAAAFAAGQSAAATYGLLPSILDAPAPLLIRQWRKAQIATSIPAMSLIATGASVFAYMATREPTMRTSSFRLYTIAALLLPSSYLYNALVVEPLAKELRDREDESSLLNSNTLLEPPDTRRVSFMEFANSVLPGNQPRVQTLNAHQLLDRWGWLNLGRAAIIGIGALVGAYAVVDEDLSFFELLS